MVTFTSASGVSSIGKDRLASDPSSLGAQESDEWRNVLHHGQPVTHAITLVELDRLGGFLGIEEGSVHRSRCYVVYAHASSLQLLADAPREMLDGCFGPGIGSIEAGERSQQCRDHTDDASIVCHMGSGSLQDKEGGLGVDTARSN